MNKKPDQTGPDLEKKPAPMSTWLRLIAVLYRLLIVVGLILGVLVISAILFTSMFSLWVLLLPVSLTALGIIMAWVEFKLHDRYYALKSKDVVAGDGQEENHADS